LESIAFVVTYLQYDHVPPNAAAAFHRIPDVDRLSLASTSGRRVSDIGFGDACRMPNESGEQAKASIHNGGKAWLLP
jgi:hypothetical protein